MEIAIKGHISRGKEVIQILESLGGVNPCNHLYGNNFNCYYEIHGGLMTCMCTKSYNYKYYTLEEFEKEFPFKIGDKVVITGLSDYPKVITKMIWEDNEILYTFGDDTWFNTGALRKLEMKEKRNITLTLDKAKEWYKKGGELKEVALQAYSEEELTKVELPKTWEEFCEKFPVKIGETWMGSYGTIYSATVTQSRIYKNWIPSKQSAGAHLAMIQLEQLRDCWRQGWEPNWLEGNVQKYVIQKWRDTISIETTYVTHSFLSFPTYEIAKEFLEYFKDLIEKAGDLI